MGGISGIYHYANEEPIGQSILRRMTEVLVHRGPDDEGFFLDHRIGLGHRRLSIIDIAGGHQPIVNEDGEVAIVFDGEIYNYLELAQHVEDRGYCLRTRSDTETILHLYEEYGEACVTMLRGIFAFAIWDGRKHLLLLARDRIGQKPLYYADHDGRLIFGSEMKAVLENPEVPRDIDEESLADYFSCGYIPAPKTIFRDVRKLRAGHYVTITPQGVQDREYWDLDFAHTEERGEAVWCASILESLCKTISSRLIGEAPLGVLLSAGISSSAVVAAMREISDRQMVTVSVGFAEENQDEAEAARWFAEQIGSDHHERSLPASSIDDLKKLAWHYDEPFADPSALTSFQLSRAAREALTVVLCGNDGDENWSGSQRTAPEGIGGRLWDLAPASIRRPIFNALSALYSRNDWLPASGFHEGRRREVTDPTTAYLNSLYGSLAGERRTILGRDLQSRLNGYNPFGSFFDHGQRPRTDDPMARVRYLDLKTRLTDDLLTKIDRASMAVSLEVRCPLLDHQFLGLMARIPSNLVMRGREGKYIFRRAVSKLLPPEIVSRPKMGMVLPLADWLRGDLYQLSNSLLFDSAAHDGLLDRAAVAKLWKQHQSKSGDNSRVLWAILMFRMWQRNFAKR